MGHTSTKHAGIKMGHPEGAWGQPAGRPHIAEIILPGS